MLGLCCQWLDENEKNTLVSRSLQLKRYNRGEYTDERIKNTYLENLDVLLSHMTKIYDAGIRSFRVSSSMFPLWDKVDAALYNNHDVIGRLRKIGEFAMACGMRITTHPGQFVVMSAPEASTRAAAIRELNFAAQIFDWMRLPASPMHAINVHGGGKPTQERSRNLIESIKSLTQSARARLTLENCEFGWSVVDLFNIYMKTNVPICFDTHHHKFNDGGLSVEQAGELAMTTWPRYVRPLTHLSNSPEGMDLNAPATKLRCHSNYIYEISDWQLKMNNSGAIDIDVEAKKKNLAIAEMVKSFPIRMNDE